MTTEPPGETLTRRDRNSLALHHLRTHFNFDPISFTDQEVIDFNNVWATYVSTKRPKP